jgi:hypothetical protein
VDHEPRGQWNFDAGQKPGLLRRHVKLNFFVPSFLELVMVSDVKDALQQYQTLQAKLSMERQRIQDRLAAINAVLGQGRVGAPGAATGGSRSLGKLAGEYLENQLGEHGQASAYTPRKGTLPAKILKALEMSGTAMQVKDIAAAVKGKPVLVSQACLMLLSKGSIKREGRGHYSLR